MIHHTALLSQTAIQATDCVERKMAREGIDHDELVGAGAGAGAIAHVTTTTTELPAGTPTNVVALQLDEVSRKWTEREEAALIAYWRDNAEQYTTKTKRFFYDGAARIPALQRKSLGQIKSKCFDIEKRYRDTNNTLRANGAAVAPGAERDTHHRWVLKKFPLYYDVHPFLRERDALAGAFLAQHTSPPPAGVPSFAVPPVSGKKRALTGGAPPPVPTQPPRAPTKRPRAEIERLAKANEAASANAVVTTAAQSINAIAVETLTAEMPATPAATPVKSAAAGAAAAASPAPPSSPYFSLQMHENKELMEAAAQKLRAEAKIATIRAHAALLRERKALLDEGVAVAEIDALLPLQQIL